jgi:regulator of chromosome condensation
MAKAKTSRSAKVSTEGASLAPTASKVRRVNTVHHSIPSLPQKSGNLLVCGQNDVGQLGLNPDDVMEKTRPALVSQISDVVVVQAGGMHSLVLTKDGTIWSFGCNDEGALGRDTSEEGSEAIPAKISLPGTVVRISAGDSHSACLLEDGRVFAWGSFRVSISINSFATQF